MSDLARANGWRGFDELARRVQGGWEYRCDGMPQPTGCPASVVVTRQWSAIGVKKSGWLVCFGEDDGPGTFDLDVVLTFCPSCRLVVEAS